MTDLKNIFEKRINKEHQVRSINGLFFTFDETLEKTNYAPSYQRNYVWDDEKATYFIESIFLGTEIPPIILFKSENEEGVNNYEVIDGRQRYETIKRFINNELKLKKNGLQRLGDIPDFVGNTFTNLDERYQNLFKDTTIRTIVYSFITDYSSEEEEIVKREIFQRYNSGITPLRTFEIDKAQNYYNSLNQALKQMLEDESFDRNITSVFRWEKNNVDQKVIKLRELLVLHRIPINYYASKKQKVISKYFEYLSSQLEEDEYDDILNSIKVKVEILSDIEKNIIDSGLSYSRLYAECIFWAISVMEQNGIKYDFSDKSMINRLIAYLKSHESDFTTVRSSFYGVLVGRYRSIASFFENEYGCSFKMSIENNDGFRSHNKLIISETGNHTVETQSFEELRIKKPQPVCVRIPELIDLLTSQRFLIRPSYQRADVKNKKKSSSIIESLILGIMLPPIFVFKRVNGTQEVVDGQQRLLSIIAYLGESYIDEKGNKQEPFLYNFKLELGKNAILKDLKGCAYANLSKADQNRIRNSSVYLIEIKEENNPNFDPVDLFIRLNNKPYPIPADSFEMWNSFAPRDLINLVKFSVSYNSKWFYFRKNNAQMENENLYTTLAYFQYQYKQYGIKDREIAPDKTIESFVVDKHLSCRFRARNEITKLLYETDSLKLLGSFDHLQFSFISNLYDLLDGANKNMVELNKSMDELLHVENGKRAQMDFYLLWILFHDLSSDIIRENRNVIKAEFDDIYKYKDYCSDIEEFKSAVLKFRQKYSREYCSMHCPLIAFVDIPKGIDNSSPVLLLNKKSPYDDRFEVVDGYFGDEKTDKQIKLRIIREDIDQKYIKAFLHSRLCYIMIKTIGEKFSEDYLVHCRVPYASKRLQQNIINLYLYIQYSNGSVRKYYERILDLAFYELYFPEAFSQVNVHILDKIKEFRDITRLSQKNGILDIIEHEYREQIKPSNIMNVYLLKAVDMSILNKIEKTI